MKVTAKIIKMPQFAKLKLTADEAASAAMAGGQVIEAHAKINAERVFSGKSTGNLAGSIQTKLDKKSAGSAVVSVGPSAVYGRIQELGGVIVPVHAKLLHWVEDGIDIFAHAVHIPPRPYLRPAVDEHEGEILKGVAAVLQRVLNRKAG